MQYKVRSHKGEMLPRPHALGGKTLRRASLEVGEAAGKHCQQVRSAGRKMGQ